MASSDTAGYEEGPPPKGKGAPPKGKGPPPKGKSGPPPPKGKGGPPPPPGEGKGGASLSYAEKKALELKAQEDTLSAEEGFNGKELTEWEAKVLNDGATDQDEGPYGGRKFLPSRGYFGCKRCGNIMYLHNSKFVH
mmetsp:Transcript_13554/g.25045  ORF Transcript_13554/g.25045 Transcript_13554/m.25045 type:complete len:136 (-) Transcript_13554:434-841(-)